jgi:purine-nucleoside/S-methyl-5'-thioadenosine phosphorylase / adenosine deaminase
VTTPAGTSTVGSQEHEIAPGFAALGVTAFTTTRAAGSYGLHSDEPVGTVVARWDALRASLGGARLASARQVHAATIIRHVPGWNGWLRADDGDGHLAPLPGTGMAVTIADCVPVFIAHRSSVTALLHSGWRGTAAHIVDRAIEAFAAERCPAAELVVHCGPAICGKCYEVSPDVYGTLTGQAVDRPTRVDLRLLIAEHARARGVREITISERCTRCDNDRFYSHRAGDSGRQLAVMIAHA